MGYITRTTVLIEIILSFAAITAYAELITKPKDAESVVGGSAYFHCSTTDPSKEIQWFHYKPRSPDKDMVYGFGEIRGAYLGRFSVKITPTGEFNLLISSAMLQDAGSYECQDEVGLGNKSIADLIVLDSNPVCQSNMKAGEEVIGPNICGMVEDVVRLSCSANFQGNLQPVLEWRKVGTSLAITQGVTHQISDSHITYNLTVVGNLLTDGSSYVCQTTRSSSPEQYSCSSGVIQVLTIRNGVSIAEITLGKEVRCSPTRNQSCIYTWTQTDRSDEVIVSNDQLLKPAKPGLYKCEASCLIKTKPCIVSTMIVHVTSNASSIPSASANCSAESAHNKDAFTAVLVILIIVLISFTILVLLYFLCWQKRKTKSRNAREALIKQQNEETNPELKVLVNNLEQKPTEKANRTEELEKLLELAQRQWIGEKDIMLRRIEECKKEPGKLFDAVGTEYTSNPILIRTIKTQASQQRGKSIKGIALLNNELFIVSHSESEVEVYDSTTFEFRRRWQLNELSNAEDAVSCARNRCLYISNAKETAKEILRVDSEGKLITKWQTNSENGRLSVTEQSTIILVLHDSSSLKEYASDGKLIKELNLMAYGLIHPMHAIKLTSGNFVVTQGYLDDSVHKLCEVDTDGKVIKSFGSEKGSGNRHLHNPIYLAIDRDGSIMVADAGNGRVVLLGSNFEFKREIVSKKDGIQIPARIRLDELNGRLHVVEYKKGNQCLLVYGIK